MEGIIKTISKGAASVVLRGVLFGFVTLITNLLILIVQWDLLLAFVDFDGSVYERLDSIFLVIGLILFPVAFFAAGIRYAIQRCICRLVEAKKYDLILLLTRRLHQAKPELFDLKRKAEVEAASLLESLVKVCDDLPSFAARIMKHLVKKAELYDLFSSSLADRQADSSDEAAIEKVAETVSNLIPEDLFAPGILPLISIFVLNISLFFL